MNEFKIESLIDSKEIISFDVFDTLVNRPFVRPSDVFIYLNEAVESIDSLSGERFSDVRVEAEKEARNKTHNPEVTLDEIYEQIKVITSISSEKLEKIKDLEVSAEVNLSGVRESGRKIFELAKKKKKKIVYISDMYLSEFQIQKILEKNGYDVNNNLFVSSDYQAVKHNGTLFRALEKKGYIDFETTLHIGDNLKSDYTMPTNLGIACIHIPKAIELFYKDPFNKKVWGFYINRRTYNSSNHQLAISSHIQMCANELYKDPYLKHESDFVFRSSPKLIGYYGFGSLIFNFVKWIHSQAKLSKIDSLIFLSRDGLILKKVYDLYMEALPESERIESKYMLSSRRAFSIPCILDEKSLIESINVGFKKCSIANVLSNKYGLNEAIFSDSKLKGTKFTSHDDIICCVEDRKDLIKILLSYQKEIISNANIERDNLKKYFDGFKLSNNSAIVDIGYSGTLQVYLNNITGFKFPAFYLTSFSKCLDLMPKGFQTYSYLDNFDDRHDTDSHWVRNLDMFEGLFSSCDGSLIKFDSKLNPITVDNSIEIVRNKLMVEIQNGALCYALDMIKKFTGTVDKYYMSPYQSYKAYKEFVYNPNLSDALLFVNSNFDDVYGGHNTARSLLADPQLATSVEQYVKCSCWKPGARLISKEFFASLPVKEVKVNTKAISNEIKIEKESFWSLNLRRLNRLKKNPKRFFSGSKYKALNIISRVL